MSKEERERRDGRGPLVGKAQIAAVLQLLRGKISKRFSCELGVTAAMLSGWRE
jgi:hypothetical protein